MDLLTVLIYVVGFGLSAIIATIVFVFNPELNFNSRQKELIYCAPRIPATLLHIKAQNLSYGGINFKLSVRLPNGEVVEIKTNNTYLLKENIPDPGDTVNVVHDPKKNKYYYAAKPSKLDNLLNKR